MLRQYAALALRGWALLGFGGWAALALRGWAGFFCFCNLIDFYTFIMQFMPGSALFDSCPGLVFDAMDRPMFWIGVLAVDLLVLKIIDAPVNCIEVVPGADLKWEGGIAIDTKSVLC